MRKIHLLHLALASAILAGSMTRVACASSDIASGADNTNPSGERPLSASASNGQALGSKALQEMFGGIVTDQTITVAGQSFYQLFVASWREKARQEQFVIAIRERPSARRGNEIWVEYAQRRVFQAILPTNRYNIRLMAEQAAEIVAKNVSDTEVQRLLFRDPDLGPDEL